jgi:hypothetical protein
VGVLDAGRQGDLFYLVMEYVEGVDLRSILRATPDGRLPLTMALFIVSEVLRGLEAVHGATDTVGQPRRIVHRDVSPANVLIDKNGLVKLGDFGIAHASSRLSRTRPGAVKGKLRYMAPEQLEGRTVDGRADLYAVGMVLCELLLGASNCAPRRVTPFGSVFRWSRRHAPAVPSDVADILDRAASEDVPSRYVDAESFRREVISALHRRHPGYGPEDLHQELNRVFASPVTGIVASPGSSRLDESDTPREAPRAELDLGDTDALFVDEQKSTDVHPGLSAVIAQAEAQLDAAAKTGLPLPRERATPYTPAHRTHVDRGARLRARLPPAAIKQALLVGAIAAVSMVLLILAVVLHEPVHAEPPSRALPVARPIAAPSLPAATASPAAVPTVGRLVVSGPPGARITLGSTSYPPPCQLELPAGRYEVKVQRTRKARPFTREVLIEGGKIVTLDP